MFQSILKQIPLWCISIGLIAVYCTTNYGAANQTSITYKTNSGILFTLTNSTPSRLELQSIATILSQAQAIHKQRKDASYADDHWIKAAHGISAVCSPFTLTFAGEYMPVRIHQDKKGCVEIAPQYGTSVEDFKQSHPISSYIMQEEKTPHSPAPELRWD